MDLISVEMSLLPSLSFNRL